MTINFYTVGDVLEDHARESDTSERNGTRNRACSAFA
ncbi:hypothetical protein [Brucella sp. NBRC 12950]|nr:hypothetical protein [Brucella sp. NBRC 12950]